MGYIKLLIFDVGGTLNDFHSLFQDNSRKVLKNLYNVNTKKEDIQKIVDRIDARIANKSHRLSQFSMTKIFDGEILKHFGIQETEMKRYNKKWDRTVDWKKLKLFPDALPVLRKLQNKYFLATLSNVHDSVIHQKALRKLKLHRHFHLHIDSDSFGFRKPRPQVFKKVLKHFNVKPEESVMIGDTPSADILGAKRLGIHTVLMNRRRLPYRFNRLTKPESEITSLRQLPNILKKLKKR